MKKLVLFLFFVSALFGADATISVINQATALPRIFIKDSSEIADVALRDKFNKIIIGDVKVSSDFEIVDNEEKAELIYSYSLSQNAGALSLDAKIFNTSSGLIVAQNQYFIQDKAKYPFLAHKSIADVVSKLGLAPIEWMDKFIVFSRYTSAKKSEIVVADYTLSYQKVIIKGGLNIFPKWASKTQDAIYYTGVEGDGELILYRYELDSGKRSKIISGSGILVASDVSSDGKKLLLTMSAKDQADIFVYDLSNKSLKQITHYPGIDVNANFVDNDSRIVFISDRLGYPNVFCVDLNGGAVEQMVFSGRNNSSVSTFGNYIVYSSREDNEFGKSFNIYLISTKTDYIRQLTASGKNTYPRFSSDGGSIVFIKQMGEQSSLGIIRLNENRSFQFPLKVGKIQSIDW